MSRRPSSAHLRAHRSARWPAVPLDSTPTTTLCVPVYTRIEWSPSWLLAIKKRTCSLDELFHQPGLFLAIASPAKTCTRAVEGPPTQRAPTRYSRFPLFPFSRGPGNRWPAISFYARFAARYHSPDESLPFHCSSRRRRILDFSRGSDFSRFRCGHVGGSTVRQGAELAVDRDDVTIFSALKSAARSPQVGGTGSHVTRCVVFFSSSFETRCSRPRQPFPVDGYARPRRESRAAGSLNA